MPQSRESQIVEWLASQKLEPAASGDVPLGIGDDMAILRAESPQVLLTTDMLLDGVHFDRSAHDLALIGRKAIACSLSDCAAMAVKPIAAAVSVALPLAWHLEDTQRLYAGMREIADAFDCPIVGGDTTSWDQRLAIDVSMLAVPFPNVLPVRRGGAKSGDMIFVTGPLGGSILGHHMTFTPCVRQARVLAEKWGDKLHAMMDISDGLSLDLHRLCAASHVGAQLDEALLQHVISPAARELATRDHRSPLDHALSDGEDFELLIAADHGTLASDNAATREISVDGVMLHRVGEIRESGFTILTAGGVRPLEPRGYEHGT